VPSLVDHHHRPAVRDQPEPLSALSRNRCPGSSGIGVRDRPDYAHGSHREEQGRFVSVLPASRKEDAQFSARIVDHEPAWTEALRRPRRLFEPDDVYETTEAPWPSAEGYRVISVRSSARVEHDAESRRARIAAGVGAIDTLNQRLASSKTRMKTVAVIEKAAADAIAEAGATRWVTFSVEEVTEVRHRQETRGRPGTNTRYRRIETVRHRPRFDVREDVMATDACSDGCWPLITSERDLTCAQVLITYKYQPNLERRNHMLKGPQDVAPVFVRDPAHIEGLMTCHFIALVVQAIVEREIRQAMAARELTEIRLYPEGRGCSTPSARGSSPSSTPSPASTSWTTTATWSRRSHRS